MDAVTLMQRGKELVSRYRYVLLVLIAGLVLMMLPEKPETTVQTQAPTPDVQPSLEERLEEILGRIKGAGKVQVLLTEYRGSETVYQTDTDRTDTDERSDTVILSDSGRDEEGLVRQVNPPIYLGALVVCQGGEIPSVKLAIVEAVMSVTGLRSTEITVLEMK